MQDSPSPSTNLVKELDVHSFVGYWRSLLKAANEQWGGITWTVGGLVLVHNEYHSVLKKYVGIPNPSPFKRCAAFALAFMDAEHYPIYGEFKNYKYCSELETMRHFSGAVLVYEYIRYCLEGAVLNRSDDSTYTLSSPIKVSEHTFFDLIHALTLLSSDGPAAFHLTSLLIEQIAYLENVGASYPRII